VQVVARIEVIDELSGGKLTATIFTTPEALSWTAACHPRSFRSRDEHCVRQLRNQKYSLGCTADPRNQSSRFGALNIHASGNAAAAASADIMNAFR
jgi:hypothetical protein